MTKQLRSVICIVTVFAVLLLAGCKDNADYNNSSASFGGAAESSQSSEISSNTSSTTDTSGSLSSSDSSASSNSSESNTSSDSQSSSNKPSTESQVHSHSYTTKKIDATCTAGGYTLKTCKCGHSEKTDKVSSLGHSFGAWTTVKEPTTAATGISRRTCSRCGKTEDKALSKLPQAVTDLQAEILRLVNVERQKVGLDPLQYYSAGQSAADTRAEEITEVFDHTRPNGSSCFTALHEAGVHYYAAGENIAMGYPTAEAVMEGWMNSEGHRANILNENFTHLIVGVNGTHWVQLFVTPM